MLVVWFLYEEKTGIWFSFHLEHKEQIDKAEEKELLQKEKEELERKEHEESKLKESKAEDNTEIIGEPEKNDIYDKVGLLDDSISTGYTYLSLDWHLKIK